MESIDAKVFAMIAAGTLVLISIAKTLFKSKVDGREPALALIIPVLFTVIGKLAGWFSGTDWAEALMWAFGGGAASGVAHDKLLDPAKGLLMSILPKKPPAQ